MTTPSARYRIRGRGVVHNIGVLDKKECQMSPSNDKIERQRPQIEALATQLKTVEVQPELTKQKPTRLYRRKLMEEAPIIPQTKTRPLPVAGAKRISITFKQSKSNNAEEDE